MVAIHSFPLLIEALMKRLYPARSKRWIITIAAGLIGLSAIGVLLYWKSASARTPDLSRSIPSPAVEPGPRTHGVESLHHEPPAEVELDRDQQEAIGLTVEPVTFGAATDVVEAPGQVIPDETQYAYITPRAAGVVRSVAAHVGQEVKAGDLLATIDSPEVAAGPARPRTRRSRSWRSPRPRPTGRRRSTSNTLELIERLEAGRLARGDPRRFEDRPVGANRERLMTAYAEYRLARRDDGPQPRAVRAER